VADNDFPPEVNQFIDATIASVDHIEVLRVLSETAGQPFTVDALASRMSIDKRSIVDAIQDFREANIVRETPGGLTFEPPLEKRETIATLIRLYNTRPVTLIRAVYSRPKPLKAFTNAFRLRRTD